MAFWKCAPIGHAVALYRGLALLHVQGHSTTQTFALLDHQNLMSTNLHVSIQYGQQFLDTTTNQRNSLAVLPSFRWTGKQHDDLQ